MLEAHNLAARRGPVRLFAGLSFVVTSGNALVVTGANGTGKTTLLRILAGLSAPERGEIRFNGTKVAAFDATVRAATMFAGHLPALKDELTTEENLRVLATVAGEHASSGQVQAALDAVQLTRHRTLLARVLSQGQRRRIGLARLILVQRPLWILDEPVTALDAAGLALLGTLMKDHLEKGGIAVAATHAPLGFPESRMQVLALS